MDGAPGRRADASAEARLRITEIFHSIQGEAAQVGWPTVFVRLTGCPLRCVWCDTEYAFQGGHWMDLGEIIDTVTGFGAERVCVTGGEPLAQPDTPLLLERLSDAGHAVSIETSGAMDISRLDPRVERVMDLKAPGSGESARNLWENLSHLRPTDQIKIVLRDRDDYEWAVATIRERELAAICPVLLSPSHGELEPARLADWILEDRLPVRFQLQLHKYVWGDEPGR